MHIGQYRKPSSRSTALDHWAAMRRIGEKPRVEIAAGADDGLHVDFLGNEQVSDVVLEELLVQFREDVSHEGLSRLSASDMLGAALEVTIQGRRRAS